MSHKYRVTSQGSIVVKKPGSRATTIILKPNQRIPDGLFSTEQMDEHLKSGFARIEGAPDTFLEQQITVPRMGRDGKLRNFGEKTPKYDLRPGVLRKKSLAQLNEIVKKIDPEEELFKDKVSAIAFLTSDLDLEDE